MTRQPPSRRSVLLGAGATIGLAALAGCTAGDRTGDGQQPRGSQPSGSALPPSPDDRTRRAEARRTAALLRRYDAARHDHPSLRAELAPFVSHHETHLVRLVPGPIAAALRRSRPTRSAPHRVPAVLRRLAEAEEQAAAARVDACRSSGAELARLLAAIGGCESAHVALLLAEPARHG